MTTSPSNVFLVWYGGGVIGVYDTQEAADRVAEARNTHAERHQRGTRRVVLAKVQVHELQSEPHPADLGVNCS